MADAIAFIASDVYHSARASGSSDWSLKLSMGRPVNEDLFAHSSTIGMTACGTGFMASVPLICVHADCAVWPETILPEHGAGQAFRCGGEDDAQLERLGDAGVERRTRRDVPVGVLVPLLQLVVAVRVHERIPRPQRHGGGRDRTGAQQHRLAQLLLPALPVELVQALQAGIEERQHVREKLDELGVALHREVHQVAGEVGRFLGRPTGLDRGLIHRVAVCVLERGADGLPLVPYLQRRARDGGEVILDLLRGQPFRAQGATQGSGGFVRTAPVDVATDERAAGQHHRALVGVVHQRAQRPRRRIPAQPELVVAQHPRRARVADVVAHHEFGRCRNARGQ
jgi:hypothetical protein